MGAVNTLVILALALANLHRFNAVKFARARQKAGRKSPRRKLKLSKEKFIIRPDKPFISAISESNPKRDIVFMKGI